MTWPRGLAIAETLWSPKDKKNWNDFANRVQHLFPRMDEAGIKYAKGIYDPIISASTDAQGNLIANLDKEIDDLDIYYSFDESNPDNYYPKYTVPLLVPKDAATLKLITYRHGKQAGRQINLPIADLKKRAGKK
jgi:hexosaminidase